MIRNAFVWLFVLGLLCLELPAQTPPQGPGSSFDIQGKLIFSTANPPEERIEVHLEKSMQRVQTVLSDSLGQFEFRGLTLGVYTVTIRLSGYEDINHSIELFGGQRIARVAIQMQPLTVIRRGRGGFEGEDTVDINLINKKYPKKAVQEYEKALTNNRKGNTARAIQHFEAALGIAPDFYQAHNNLGVAYLKLERFRDAERHYRAAKELNPKGEQPLLNLAILFIAESDTLRPDGRAVYGRLLDEAMDNLDEALKIKPGSAIAHFYLGTAYYKSDFYQEAEASLNKAWTLDAKLANVRLMLINVYIKLKRWNDVIAQINAFIRETPDAPERKGMEELREKLARELSKG